MIFTIRVIQINHNKIHIQVRKVSAYQTLNFKNCDFYQFSEFVTCITLNKKSFVFLIRSKFGFEGCYQNIGLKELPEFLKDIEVFNLSLLDYNYITYKTNYAVSDS
ncbi:hypothetical protein [Guagua virus]|uniref:Uncharacterized protein n=1 Tax=Guagua virus TaxID=2689370 RepID=A0A6B9KLN9_9VIRU|nr:hypothetical protein QK835_sSgp1 [Guagua virus]QHA33856.1 hypothetical protein [Guagua virus]